ncbi:MAG: hypothetical protein CO132_02950 [Candidatus Kerfeldbacteria bacterium CG_4_9_14_3_um_filter_45_8]|nr:MAG: hypothetical protein CO132_02950 [Candidatus Kerfeldbacteria bacterium CG_4_9_14_3_um_filter_45_8]
MSKSAEVTTQRWSWIVFLQSEFFYLLSFVLAAGITMPFLRATADVAATSNPVTSESPGSFLVIFGVATVLAVILVKYLSDGRFWSFFFGAAAFSGLFLTIYYPLVLVFTQTLAMVMAIIFALIMLVGRVKSQRIWLHNLIVLLATVGVARLFGTQFTPEATVNILLFLAAYDIIAVYFTKHMIAMAVTLFERQAFFGLVLTSKLKGWHGKLSDLELQNGITVVGGGDIAFPLFFALTILIFYGSAAFWIMCAATLVGVLLMHLLAVYPKTKRPIPGLPPLVLCSLVGYSGVLWLIAHGLIG